MQITPKNSLITVAILSALGVVSIVSYPEGEEPIINEGEVIQEIKVEEANIPSETLPCYGGLTCNVVYIKTYISEDGATRDTPKAGYTLVTEKKEMITQSTIVETAQEKESRFAANEVAEAAQKIKSENDRLYKKIGELEVLKLGGKTGLNSKILDLQSQIH